MSALLFIVGIAVLLGLAQLLGWTRDSRDSADWHQSDDKDRHHTHAA
ncbi:MAG TPA: hypothetical protein VGN37_10605 [Actinocatenispora sp.]